MAKDDLMRALADAEDQFSVARREFVSGNDLSGIMGTTQACYTLQKAIIEEMIRSRSE